jgi:hypothetical protein
VLLLFAGVLQVLVNALAVASLELFMKVGFLMNLAKWLTKAICGVLQ